MSKGITAKQLQPLAGYVLVQPAKQEKKTASGLYLPDDHEDKPQHGKVLSCGGDITENGSKVSCPVKKGDQVIYKKWGGNDLKLEDTEYQFLKFEDILAVVK